MPFPPSPHTQIPVTMWTRGHKLQKLLLPLREREEERQTDSRQLARNVQANLFPSTLGSEPSVMPDSRVYEHAFFFLILPRSYPVRTVFGCWP
jgi:hypothetical protein